MQTAAHEYMHQYQAASLGKPFHDEARWLLEGSAMMFECVAANPPTAAATESASYSADDAELDAKLAAAAAEQQAQADANDAEQSGEVGGPLMPQAAEHPYQPGNYPQCLRRTLARAGGKCDRTYPGTADNSPANPPSAATCADLPVSPGTDFKYHFKTACACGIAMAGVDDPAAVASGEQTSSYCCSGRLTLRAALGMYQSPQFDFPNAMKHYAGPAGDNIRAVLGCRTMFEYYGEKGFPRGFNAAYSPESHDVLSEYPYRTSGYLWSYEGAIYAHIFFLKMAGTSGT
jgi:hypothetical protein